MSTESTGSAETPIQCVAVRKKDGQPCRKRAVVGGELCHLHLRIVAPAIEARERELARELAVAGGFAPVPPIAKIGLLGFTSSRLDAPYDDPTWRLAGCNNLWRQPGMEELWQKCEAWYDLHPLWTFEEDEEHLKWMRVGAKPTFVLPHVKQADWPSALDFPHQEILAWLKAKGVAGARYFTNSVSWMIAHAHMLLERQGFDQGRGGEIGLWGIDMAVQTEYGSQRPSCEYFLGLAEASGIKVTVAERSDLLKAAGLYGVDDLTDITRKLADRERELTASMEQINAEVTRRQNEINELTARYHQHAGAKENTSYIRGVWFQPQGARGGGDDPYSTSQPVEAFPSGA